MPYLHFPSLDVLSLVLVSRALPGSVQLSSCSAYHLPGGELLVEPAQELDSETIASLERFGVKQREELEKRGDAGVDPLMPLVATCWQQLLPLRRSEVDDSSEVKTVLLRTHSSERFTALVNEMIRLGNDRISFRHVDAEVDVSGQVDRQIAHPPCTLVRVIDPPYYTMVDVLDGNLQRSNKVIAYREQAPRVWVPIGYEHAMADRIDPPAGHFLLIDPPHGFQFVKEAPFQDVYQSLDLRMPLPVHAWQPVEVETHLEVPLTLTNTASNNAAELWVIRRDALQQVEQLVTRSDDELVERLAFAVVMNDAEPVVILRARPSRAALPILVLDADAYSTFLRLPNLFVPLGMRLQPPLRRDAIAKLLASDNRSIFWLEVVEPRDTSRRFWPFQAQSIPDAAFRPLSDWVEYLLDHHAQALVTWTASHRFEFEAFVCREDLKEPHNPASDSDRPAIAKPAPAPPAAKPTAKKAQATATEESAKPPSTSAAAEPRRISTNEFIEQLKQAEATFLASTSALDAPERGPMWQHLGWLNSQLKHHLDATICWSNYLWYPGGLTPDATHQWLQAELRSAGLSRIDSQAIRTMVTHRHRRGRDTSLVAAYVVRAVSNEQGRTDLRGIAPELTRFFEEQEHFLPVRTVWLTALAMHQLVGGDALGLARVRDRLLNRLYEHGLMGEYDIVGFLRGSGQRQSDQHRALRGSWQELLEAVNGWLSVPLMTRNQTKNYVKFIFAYCLVRLGEVVSGRELLHMATNELDAKDSVHLWMGLAFNFRVEQASQGGNDREPLPEDLLRNLEHMDRLDRYKIDRMRQHSRVLEPHERIDASRYWRRYADELFQTLAELSDTLELKQVESKLRQLLKEHSTGTRGLRVLATALEYAPRLGDEFATQLLERVDNLLASSTDAIEKALLIHRSLYVAGHFGHSKRVNSLVLLLSNELPAIVDDYLKLESRYNPVDRERIETVEVLLRHSFRGLRKLGLREELSALYGRIAELVETHHLRAQASYVDRQLGKDASLSLRLSLLLCVASGYYYFGNSEGAEELVNKVRDVLLTGELASVEQRRLAIAYVYCVSLGHSDSALRRIFELFKRRPDGQRVLLKIEDTMTTSSHFSVSELELVEACLLSLLSDETSWDPQCQLWLDQDEFAIRKKIHADMRRALK